MPLVDQRRRWRNCALFSNWHAACSYMNNSLAKAHTMTTAASPARPQHRQFGKSALDRAMIASVAAMVGFNLLVLSQQLDASPAMAATPAATAQA